MQSKVLEIFSDMIKDQDLTPDELFSMIDTDGSGVISTHELKAQV